MRLIDFAKDAIPFGQKGVYLWVFVKAFLNTLAVLIIFWLLVLLICLPIAAACTYDNILFTAIYLITIPCFITAHKFIEYHLGWDRFF